MSEQGVIGRPTIYTPELAEEVCKLVSIHPIGLPKLCSKFPHLPSTDTIRSWRLEKPDFSLKYTEAKKFQAEMMAESLEEVCDDLELNAFFDEHGNKRLDSGLVAHARLKVDVRRWTASKLAPKVYGDKKELEQAQAENVAIKEELKALRAELAEKNRREY